MIYLNEGFFKPMFIFVSMLLLPISTACWILTFYDFRIELLIVTLIISLIYFISVVGIYIYSKTKKYTFQNKNRKKQICFFAITIIA